MSKTWFIIRSLDYVLGGQVALGSIIENAAKPGDSLNYEDLKTRAPNDIIEGPSTDLAGELRKIKDRQGGVWIRFLELVTSFSVRCASVTRDSNEDEFMRYKFDSIKTFRFIPSPEYLNDVIAAAPRVEEAIKKSNYDGSIYMITGIKVAENAEVSWIQGRNQDSTGQVGLSSAAIGLEIGPSMSNRSVETERTVVKGRINVIIAFELGEIRYDKHGYTTSTSHKGDLLSAGKQRSQAKIRVLGLWDWKVTKGHFTEPTYTVENE